MTSAIFLRGKKLRKILHYTVKTKQSAKPLEVVSSTPNFFAYLFQLGNDFALIKPTVYNIK